MYHASADSQPSTTVSLNVQRNFIIVSWPPPGGEDFVVNYILMYTSVSKVDQQTASGNITIPSNQTSYNFTSPFLLPYSDYSFALFADFGDGEVPQIVAPFAAVSQETGTYAMSISLCLSYTPFNMQAHPHTRMHACTHTYTHTCTHARTHTPTHPHTHTRTHTNQLPLHQLVSKCRASSIYPSTSAGQLPSSKMATSLSTQ